MTSMSRAEQILKIQELCFACVDLNLYLDNNPTDKNAICLYNSLGEQFEQAVKAYEKKYGPLMNFGHSRSSCPFQWVDEPWPWQKEYYE